MAFTSLIFFFIFFPVCILVYYGIGFIGNKWKKIEEFRVKDIILVIFSIGFYGWACLDDIIFLLGYVILIYFLGHVLEMKNKTKQPADLFVYVSVGILAVVLFGYKYMNFTIRIWNRIWGTSQSEFHILAPLGLSFITFSAISYLIDVYRKDAEAGNFLDVALYITFFPKVISGPIQLWKDFRGQINRKMLDSEEFVQCLNRILVGMAKKVILADTFGGVVTSVQSNVGYGIDILTALGGALLYMLQIYYDFSGYSDIAIGLAGMFGIQIKNNFQFPYISQSITEFWRRWHISLGTWFREYVYIPLGGNRKGYVRTLVNLFIVFLLTGIWHGAGWNYIFWGCINGFCVVFERCVQKKNWYLKIPAVIKWGITMFIVFISWVFFRLPYMSDILQYLGIMFGRVQFDQIDLGWKYFFDYKIIVFMTIGLLGATVFSADWIKKKIVDLNNSATGFVIQEIFLLTLGVITVMCMVNSTYSPFLYFQY